MAVSSADLDPLLMVSKTRVRVGGRGARGAEVRFDHLKYKINQAKKRLINTEHRLVVTIGQGMKG